MSTLTLVESMVVTLALGLLSRLKQNQKSELKASTAQGQKLSEIFIKGKCDKAKVKLNTLGKCMDHMETLLTAFSFWELQLVKGPECSK